jgi:hypothetical protein
VRIGIIPFEGGRPVKTFDVPPTMYAPGRIGWTLGRRSVAYVDLREGVSNIWAATPGRRLGETIDRLQVRPHLRVRVVARRQATRAFTWHDYQRHDLNQRFQMSPFLRF